MCYHADFGSSVIKGVCINRREPSKFWSDGTPQRISPGEGALAPHAVFCGEGAKFEVPPLVHKQGMLIAEVYCITDFR